jgi:ABC-type enterobactin transport system permease subunit
MTPVYPDSSLAITAGSITSIKVNLLGDGSIIGFQTTYASGAVGAVFGGWTTPSSSTT